jgi:hypothetical protein
MMSMATFSLILPPICQLAKMKREFEKIGPSVTECGSNTKDNPYTGAGQCGRTSSFRELTGAPQPRLSFGLDCTCLR